MKKAPLISVLLLLLLAAVTGCSRYYWSKPGATAEQFTQDNQACVQQAAGALPAGAASLDAVRQYYRACLNSRGYARDKQIDPPPPGSYRGIENSEEFNATAQAAMPQGPPRRHPVHWPAAGTGVTAPCSTSGATGGISSGTGSW